jgi:GNAT superfamily N-acetyltransferase
VTLIRELGSTEPLRLLKGQLVAQATAPLDGMWLCGFVPLATHYGFYEEDELVGFCCVNDDGYLLQFFLSSRHQDRSSSLFEAIAQSKGTPTPTLKGAIVSTAEPHTLSLCLDQFSVFEVNALMYQQRATEKEPERGSPLPLVVLQSTQLLEAVAFAKEAIGAPEGWLTGYYTNLISRQELFGVWEKDRLVATGESRGYDAYQTGYADLGVVVAESERGKGLATRILRQLVAMNEERGLKSICSTERTNVAAQKAITRAGFFASNRIVRFEA